MRYFSIFLALLLGISLTAQTTIFFDDFENGDLGAAWTARPNLSGQNGFVGVQAGVGVNGTFGVSIGKLVTAGQFTNNGLDLAVDLSGQSDLELSFSILDLADESNPDDGLYFSDDGGTSFTQVLRFYGTEWCDFVYGEFPPLDVDALAAANGLNLNANFVIRWQQRGVGPFNTGSPDGFRLDNVSLVSRPIVYAVVDADNEFFADFNDNSFGSNSWAWRFGDQTTALNLPTQPTNPSNIVGVGLNDGIDGTPGIFMGRRCAGPVTTAALDLHLDLAGEDDVKLAFWIYDFNDLTQVDDGLYFSNDGGQNFTKALDFDPDDWCDFLYGFYVPVDIDAIATELNLPLTDQFIIRFQQAGGRPFNTGDPAGFRLDNVQVFHENINYAEIPFEDNFNNGTFKDAWAWTAADATADLNLPNDPSSPHNALGVNATSGNNGTPGVFIGRDCAGPLTTNALDLRLNLEGEEQIFLDFDYYDNNDLTHETDGIYFSDDGGDNFTKVFDFEPDEYCDFLYLSFPSVDVDALAAAAGLELTSQFVIRFQQTDGRPFNTGDAAGLLLDNVRVTPAPIIRAAIPFVDNFDNLTFMPGWRLGNPTNSSNLVLDNAVRGAQNVIGVGDQSGINGTAGVFMTRECAGPLTVNALDLYVDMAFQTNATLDFLIFDLNDLTHIDDGIYFSDDNAETFIKAVDFDPNAWADFTWFEFPTVNITEIATQLGLSMNSNFVIRFQQAGSRPFNTGDPAGFVFDNVVINGAPSSTAEFENSPVLRAVPNPASESITLNLPLEAGSRFQLVDATGRLLQEGIWTGRLNTAALPAGVYQLVLTPQNSQRLQTVRFVKR